MIYNLSKSGYCDGVQCEKILWLKKFKKELLAESSESSLKKGNQVGEFAKGLFGDYTDIPYDADKSVMIEKTLKSLKDKSVITEASFSHDDNFCSVDILKNDSDGVEIYEVKSSTEIREIYLDDVAYQYYVLSNSGLNVKKASIVYINNQYIRGKDLNMNELFNIEDVTDIVIQKQGEVQSNIDKINEFMSIHNDSCEPVKDIGIHCVKPYECPFWQYCTRELPKPNVFDIVKMRWDKKFKKYFEGKVSFKDLENDKDITTPRFVEQIDFEVNNRPPKINKKPIQELLDSLKYPLYFIDYETCQYPIPEFEGTKAYQQIPFQYSLHIIHEDGELEHKEFLADAGDENIIGHFAESMIRDMPEDGSVIVYNKSFESTRNKEIGQMFPDLKVEMDRFNANIVDLEVPFKKRDYYVKEMEGYSSIKKVLPALYPDDPSLNYSNLDLIHKGDEASDAFLSLKNKSCEEQKMIREALLKYCELDTFAMVKIWEKLNEVVK